MLKLNNLQANTIIYPGQKIKLTGSKAAPAATASASATVKPATAASGAGSVTSSRPATPSVPSLPATASAFPRSSSGTGSAWAPSSTPDRRSSSAAVPLPLPLPLRPVGAHRNAAGARQNPGQLRFLHDQGRRHALRHCRPERRSTLGRPVRQPADDPRASSTRARSSLFPVRPRSHRLRASPPQLHRWCPARSSGSPTRPPW